MFSGEIEKEEEAETWLSGMNRYFQIYNYSDELKAKMTIYNLIGKAVIWWQDIKKVKNIKECYVTQKNFKKNFKRNVYHNNIMRKKLKNSMNYDQVQ